MRTLLVGVGAVCLGVIGAFLVACGNAGPENATLGGPDATAEGSGDNSAAETGSGTDGNSTPDAPRTGGGDGSADQDARADARGDANTGSGTDVGADVGADAVASGGDASTIGCSGPSWPADATPPPVHICAFANDGGNVFPLFDKCCETDSDCAFGVYMYSCCGDTLALGFNKSQTAAFDAKNAQWNCAACGCAGAGMHTEDGHQAVADAGVRCDNSFCETFAR